MAMSPSSPQMLPAALAALSLASSLVASPVTALAAVGPIHVNEVSVSGAELPPSTISVYDEANDLIGTYENSSAASNFDLPESITSRMGDGHAYVITATADGFTFTKMRGVMEDGKSAVVDIVGMPAVLLDISLHAQGVSDYSYVHLSLHKGGTTDGEAMATISPTAGGYAEIASVPVGMPYTLAISCPPELAGQLPATVPIDVPEDARGHFPVEVRGSAASLEAEQTEVAAVPQGLPADPSQGQQAQPQPADDATKPIEQTGDKVVIVSVAAIAVGLIGILIMVRLRK